jgi:2-polyprenyl-3-methyl-5-hydroxy-6-metoxy-1,4-benzoquinol methylase
MAMGIPHRVLSGYCRNQSVADFTGVCNDQGGEGVGTDKDWQKWGEQAPYFGVLSSADFNKSNLSDVNRTEFFRTGEEHVDEIFAKIRRHVAGEFNPLRSIDFGCGVGRLVIPLSRRCAEVTGIDVADSMLAEARVNCSSENISNAKFIKSDDQLSQLAGNYDFIHSVIVFQHIQPTRGERLVGELLKHLAPSGVVALQFFYRSDAPKWVRALVKLRYRVPLANFLRNIIRGRPMREPAMQLHCYDLDALVGIFKAAGIQAIFLDLYEAFGFQGAMIYGKKMDSKQNDPSCVHVSSIPK